MRGNMSSVFLSTTKNGNLVIDSTRIHGKTFFGMHLIGSPGTRVEVWGTVDGSAIDWYLISTISVDIGKTEEVDQRELYAHAIRYRFVAANGTPLSAVPNGARFHLCGVK